MSVALRRATIADVAALLPRTRALNAHEGIAIGDAELEAALRRLLADRTLGGVWLVERGGEAIDPPHRPAPVLRGPAQPDPAIGYAIVTFGFDLEFGGRDAYLTELWIDPHARGVGAGTSALALLDGELRHEQVRALHLQVRPDNPALHLYERVGFVRSPRLVLTRRIG